MCPICGNTIGFAFGTCVSCGYNYIDGEYTKIQVRTDILKELVSPEIYEQLVREHEKRYTNFGRYKVNLHDL